MPSQPLWPPRNAPMTEKGIVTPEWLMFFNTLAVVGPTAAITQLTGDVTATGPGSVVASIAPGVIVDADVNAAAAIAWSKIATTGQVVNADVNASAAVDLSKLQTIGDKTIVGNSSGGVAVPSTYTGNLGTSVSYTPTWTGAGSNPALGNGTLAGNYIQIGKLVFAQIVLLIGSTTTFGTGAWIFTKPVNSADLTHVGQAQSVDDSAGSLRYICQSVPLAASTLFILSPTGNVQSTVPFTWAVNDLLTVTFWYEAA